MREMMGVDLGSAFATIIYTARIGYRRYYARMTSNIGFVFSRIVSVSELQLPESIILEKTDIEEERIKKLFEFFIS